MLATGGVGKSWKYTSNSWECTGDGHAMALWAGADLIDMECVQFHPTGMVWPLSVRGILVTEGVRGDGGVLRNTEGQRFMFDYVADMFRAETADTEEEADRWYEDHIGQPPAARAAAPRRGRPGHQHRGEGRRGAARTAACSSTSPRRRSAEYIRRRLPSMYHQFMELAGVDITSEPMEVGPTCHYIMGGVRVDADTAAATVPGLFAAGEVAGGMHGSNRLGGNSLSDLWCSAAGPAIGAVGLRRGPQRRARPSTAAEIDQRRSTAALAPFERDERREPLRAPPRAAGHHAGPGRHHPDRRRARAGARASSASSTERAAKVVGRRRPRLQPRLEPGHRPAGDAHRVDAA